MDDSANFIEKMLELGIGISMVKQVPEMLEGLQMDSAPSAAVQNQASFYIIFDGTQAGPFNDDELIKLIKADYITSSTLVWQAGMTSWTQALDVPQMQRLFVLSKVI